MNKFAELISSLGNFINFNPMPPGYPLFMQTAKTDTYYGVNLNDLDLDNDWEFDEPRYQWFLGRLPYGRGY